MASILIRQLPDFVKIKLKERAAQHGHSMEEEAREILTRAAAVQEESGRSLVDDIRDLFAPFGGVDLPEVPDGPIPDPPDFS